MWLLVFFDLPTETKQDKKNYTKFRDTMLEDGFTMFQFSIYVRHCASRENMEVHLKHIKKALPEKGEVGIMAITDKQFGMMEIFKGTKPKPHGPIPQQLEMF
ncbi:MAG: CRISPR-associated protein Cas2 family [Bacteroidota bacterium]|nr:CRISPR-associated protein Cas2 family [Bacteroidota bacterium]